MKRRDFIKNSSLCAIAISTSGFVFRKGKQYTGDCETTTDILGPYYRPGSPVRNNFLVNGETENIVQLSGIIKHKDCITPYKNAKIELWHCSNAGEYDNNSKEYKYRGTTFSDITGKYTFKTVLPVPYDAGDGQMRPAHFHLMITAPGYHSLITQLYFTGDPFIKDDICASNSAASRRILNVESLKNGLKKVSYDVSMSPKLNISLPSLNKLIGIYIDELDSSKRTEFFKHNNALWKKNEVFGNIYDYLGDNNFSYNGIINRNFLAHFDIMPDKSVKLTQTITAKNGNKHIFIGYKDKISFKNQVV